MSSKKLFRDISMLTVSRYMTFCLNAARGLLLAKWLGPAAFGQWTFLKVFLNYGDMSHLGFRHALVKEVPLERGRGHESEIPQIERHAFWGMLVLSLVAGTALILAAFFLSGHSLVFRWGLLITGLTIPLAQINCFYLSLHRANHEFKAFALINLALEILIFLFVIILIGGGKVLGVLCAQFTANLLLTLYLVKKNPRPLQRVGLLKERFLSLFKSGFPIGWLGLMSVFLFTLDRLAIGKFLGKSYLGYYGLASMISSLLASFLTNVEYIFFPKIGEKIGQNDLPAVAVYLLKPAFVLSVILSSILGVLYFMLPLGIHFFMPQYQPALQITRLLIASIFFTVFTGNAGSVFIATGKYQYYAAILGGLTVVAGTAYGVVLAQGMGLLGVTWVTVIVKFLYAALLFTGALCLMGRKISEAAYAFALRLIPFGYAVLLVYFAESFSPPGEFPIQRDFFRLTIFVIGFSPLLIFVERRENLLKRFQDAFHEKRKEGRNKERASVITDCSPLTQKKWLRPWMEVYFALKDALWVCPAVRKLSLNYDVTVLCRHPATRLRMEKMNVRVVDFYDYLDAQSELESVRDGSKWVKEFTRQHNNHGSFLNKEGVSLLELIEEPFSRSLERASVLRSALRNFLSREKPEHLYLEMKGEKEDRFLEGLLDPRKRSGYLIPPLFCIFKLLLNQVANFLLYFYFCRKIAYRSIRLGNVSGKPALLFFSPGVNSTQATEKVLELAAHHYPEASIQWIYPREMKKVNHKPQNATVLRMNLWKIFSFAVQGQFYARVLKTKADRGIPFKTVLRDGFGGFSEWMLGQSLFWLDYWKHFLNQKDFDLIVTGNGRVPSSMSLILLAKQRGKKSLEIQDAPFVEEAQSNYSKADVLACASTEDTFDAERWKGARIGSVICTGLPRYDPISNLREHSEIIKRKVAKQLGISETTSLVLYTSQHSEDVLRKEMALECLLSTLSHFPDKRLIIKLHPYEKDGIVEKMIQKVDYPVSMVSEINIFEIILASDVVITRVSSTGLEALALGKKLIILNLTGQRDLIPYVEEGGAWGVYRPEDLEPALLEIFQPFVFGEGRMEKARAFVGKYFGAVDGKASERVFETLREMLNGKADRPELFSLEDKEDAYVH